MRRLWIIFLILLTACSGQGDKPYTSDENLSIEQPVSGRLNDIQFAEKLHTPWSITKKNSIFYISERNGTIAMIDQQSGETSRLPIQFEKKLYTGGEGGLLGLELIPETDLEAYAYHTYEENGKILNRLIRIEKGRDDWIEKSELLASIPGAQIHNGGRVKIGPDEKLYVTAGDVANPDSAQDLDILSGKILRLEQDGSIPEDNPFTNSLVYSYGHRNPQGIAWDEKEQMYATEHGQSAHDEINKIEPGKNYGWPDIQGDEKKAGMITPIFQTNGNTWAPSGTAYHNGKLYIATLRGEAVRVYDLINNVPSILTEGNGRIRDVLIENDILYFITNNTDGRGTPSENDDRLLSVELK